MENFSLQIDSVGHQGDGIASTDDGPVYVPMTLPGEKIIAQVKNGRGKLVKIQSVSKERCEPACEHFQACGACSLQHWDRSSYLEWKRVQVENALRQNGIQTSVATCIPVEPGSRRRAVFSFRAAEFGVHLGFHARQSDQILNINSCPVLQPDLEQFIDLKENSPLRRLAACVVRAKTEERMTVHLGKNGLSVALTGRNPVSSHERAALWSACAPFYRVTLNGEVAGEDRGIDVVESLGAGLLAPPGVFLQATESSEQKLIELAIPHLNKCRNVADLFSGIGTFSVPLARRASVTAIDGDKASILALEMTAARVKGIKKISATRRDLFKFPLSFQELKEIDGALIDPPRAGAEAQCKQLARSKVQRVAYVSCNPQSFARDAKILMDGGYRLSKVTPVDQFLWSHHIELVGLFAR